MTMISDTLHEKLMAERMISSVNVEYNKENIESIEEMTNKTRKSVNVPEYLARTWDIGLDITK